MLEKLLRVFPSPKRPLTVGCLLINAILEIDFKNFLQVLQRKKSKKINVNEESSC